MTAAAPRIRAVAFDLDGTLVDSAPDIGHALNSAMRGAGLAQFDTAQVRAWVGDGPDVLIERALRSLGVPDSAALRAELRRGFDAATLQDPLAHGSVYAGIEALLRQLRAHWPMAVVTNKPTALARAVLGAAGLLPFFKSVHGADSAALRKPAPALLQHAALALDVAPHELLMVGDSGADMGCAVAAGAATAWAGWGYGLAHALTVAPMWRVQHPREVLGIVQAVH